MTLVKSGVLVIALSIGPGQLARFHEQNIDAALQHFKGFSALQQNP
jgi:hypothetical protein